MLLPSTHIKTFLPEDNNWNDIVTSFQDYDVYYLAGYVKGFEIHGDGQPYLVYFNHNGLEGIYVFMLRETPHDGWYDIISPYGYGGFLLQGDLSKENLDLLYNEWRAFASINNIIDNFVRFNPLSGNANILNRYTKTENVGQTIVVNLISKEQIWSDISSKNRNMIRKAQKNGVTIHHGKGLNLLNQFVDIYNGTMDKVNASSYYYFDIDFYSSIDSELKENYEVFYALYNNKIIAISIILYANGKMHYHFSGSLLEYRHLAPSNLMLYMASLWGVENGMKKFHLGGGLGASEDNLFKFKASFNPKGVLQFSIGKEIFNKEKYESLVEESSRSNPNFNPSSSFFPLYRSSH